MLGGLAQCSGQVDVIVGTRRMIQAHLTSRNLRAVKEQVQILFVVIDPRHGGRVVVVNFAASGQPNDFRPVAGTEIAICSVIFCVVPTLTARAFPMYVLEAFVVPLVVISCVWIPGETYLHRFRVLEPQSRERAIHLT